MTQLQKKAMEHVDSLLINAHNDALNITDIEKTDVGDGEIVGIIATKGFDLAKDINEIQMWCRNIYNDPQE